MTTVGSLLRDEIPRLNRYARVLMRNRDGAEDLVQETVLRALEKAHLWQPGTDLRAWLFTLMHNHYVNFVRRSVLQGRRVDVDRTDASAPAAQLASLILRDLERAIAGLPEGQRKVLRLVGIHGMKYHEAAAACGVPINTIRSRLCRAREALHAKLEGSETHAETAEFSPERRRAGPHRIANRQSSIARQHSGRRSRHHCCPPPALSQPCATPVLGSALEGG